MRCCHGNGLDPQIDNQKISLILTVTILIYLYKENCCGYFVFSIFRVFFVSFFVPYVNVFFHFLHFVAYIFVLSLHVHLVLVYRPVHMLRLGSQNPVASIFVSRLVYRLFCIFLLVFCRLRLVICSNSFYVYL